MANLQKNNENLLNDLFGSLDDHYQSKEFKSQANISHDIKMINGRWTNNGNTYDEMSLDERDFLDAMFRTVKFESITIFQ